jgi:DNA mismatch endonuclease Vsr
MSGNTLFDQNPQMAGNKGKDTYPERKISRILTSMGYRYRKNYSQLPGRPDFAFTKKRKVLFVNGCWWHLHAGCADVRSARTNRHFWDAKLGATAVRDERNRVELARLGWDEMTIWSCELEDEERLKKKLRNFLDTDIRRSIELFTGAGGLALAVSRNGFKHEALVENDSQACEMVRFNQERAVPLIREWPLFEMDVKDFDYRPYEGSIDLLGAGSPCQPFSLGGNHKAEQDTRNMFPEVVRAIRELKPKAVVVENVKGLKR